MAIDRTELELAVAERLIEDLHNQLETVEEELVDANDELSGWREMYWTLADKYAMVINKLGEIVEGAVE